MDLNLADPLLFGNDAGEDEDPKVLASYFVDQPAFQNFLDESRRLGIARGRKGMGKSALLAKLAHDIRQRHPDAFVLFLTGSDLTGLGEFDSEDPSVLISQWQQVICSRVSMEIGRRLNWAADDASMMLVGASELAGLKGRNVLRALFDRIKGKLGAVELQKLSAPDHAQLLRQVSVENDDALVWLLIDDIDSTFVNSVKLKNKVSSFFSACRRLVQSVTGLRIRASVRADVWPVLRDNEDLDKCEQYMTDIRWSGVELASILTKRILAYVQRNHPRSTVARWNLEYQADALTELVFLPRLPWGGSLVPPAHVVRILAAKRPRWMAQLCRLAGTEATRVGRSRISMEAINPIMPTFGKLRVSDLFKEHAHQFADIKRLIECFARGPRRYGTHELQQRIVHNYISRVGAAHVPDIDGDANPNAMQIAHFLFKIGFLQGRSGSQDNPTFVDYDDRPNLLTTTINPDDGMSWEIYPSYRSVLSTQ